MKQLILEVNDNRYRQLLAFLETLDYVQVVLDKKEKKEKKARYDFADLVGKLEWKGDAVTQQRLLSDEW